MTTPELADLSQIVHVVDGDHRNRAQIAMTVTQSGGHPEIYENIGELVDANPQIGTILASADLSSPADLLNDLHANEIFLPVIIFAENPRPSQIVRAAHDGIADYLAWPFSADELWTSSAYCQAFIDGVGGTIMRRQRARVLVENLSLRERQILALILEGYSNKSIASTLDLSPRTIEDYRLNALKKLGVNATSSAIRIGLEAGLNNFENLGLGNASLTRSARP